MMNRRHLMQGSALALGVAAAGLPSLARAGAEEAPIAAEEHWAKKGSVDLYLYRKRLPGEGRPVLVLVHGSSFSGRGGFDLQVPGHPRYSLMDEFARAGFDVWAMDHEGYGRSTRTESHAGILVGVEDLQAAMATMERLTGRRSVMMFGQSSGAIRAGAYANREPERVERLVLDAFTWTGEGAPEIMRRRARADEYRANPHRKVDRSTFTGIFSRDDPSTFEPAVPEALAAFELAMGDRVPSGTYLDMAVNLPLVDPRKIACPVLMLRAEHDGNATDEELLQFFAALPARDKQFVVMSGTAHVAVLGTNRHKLWHAMRAFLGYPLQRGV
jgi:pimeloyl-ACP methyl ester carboxylesterase